MPSFPTVPYGPDKGKRGEGPNQFFRSGEAPAVAATVEAADPPNEAPPEPERTTYVPPARDRTEPLWRPREYQDASGEFKVVATFVSYGSGVVTLEKENGKRIKVPMDKFSGPDRRWLDEQLDKLRR